MVPMSKRESRSMRASATRSRSSALPLTNMREILGKSQLRSLTKRILTAGLVRLKQPKKERQMRWRWKTSSKLKKVPEKNSTTQGWESKCKKMTPEIWRRRQQREDLGRRSRPTFPTGEFSSFGLTLVCMSRCRGEINFGLSEVRTPHCGVIPT